MASARDIGALRHPPVLPRPHSNHVVITSGQGVLAALAQVFRAVSSMVVRDRSCCAPYFASIRTADRPTRALDPKGLSAGITG